MSDVLRQPLDRNSRAMPKEGARRRAKEMPGRGAGRNGQPSGQAALWAVRAVDDFAPDEDARRPDFWGAFPQRFETWAARAMGVQPNQILHVCSGRLPLGSGWLRIDIRTSMRPDIVADGTALPLADGVARAVLIDPPYTEEYARDLYGTKYARPSGLLREAVRVARPGAPIGFLHFLVPMSEAGSSLERVYGITTGAGYRIRAFSIFRKAQAELFDHALTTAAGCESGRL